MGGSAACSVLSGRLFLFDYIYRTNLAILATRSLRILLGTPAWRWATGAGAHSLTETAFGSLNHPAGPGLMARSPTGQLGEAWCYKDLWARWKLTGDPSVEESSRARSDPVGACGTGARHDGDARASQIWTMAEGRLATVVRGVIGCGVTLWCAKENRRAEPTLGDSRARRKGYYWTMPERLAPPTCGVKLCFFENNRRNSVSVSSLVHLPYPSFGCVTLFLRIGTTF